MSGYYGDDYQIDYLQGQAVDIQNQIAEAQSTSTSSGTLPSGTSGQIYIVDAGGNPVAANVDAGDTNGASLVVTGGELVVTLTQDLKSSASPTFKELSLTDATIIANLSITASAGYVQAESQAVIDKVNALLQMLRDVKINPV